MAQRNGTKRSTDPALLADKPLQILEDELDSKERSSKRHKGHTEIHSLTAREERGRRIQNAKNKKKSTAKKYDGRAFSKNAVVSRQKVREALEGFYKEVKLPELKQALEVSNDPRYNMLLASINNPRMNGCSFAELCRKCRMSIQDVVEVWRNHLKMKGITRMMEHMPDIMEDVAIDSKSKVVKCDKCQGEGKLYGQTINRVEDPICPDCHGDGVIRIQGDKDARLLAFETVGLRKGSVGQVNVLNVNKGVASLEDQIADLDKVFDADFTTISEEVEDGRTSYNDSDGDASANEAAGAEGGNFRVKALPEPEDGDDGTSDPTDYSS